MLYIKQISTPSAMRDEEKRTHCEVRTVNRSYDTEKEFSDTDRSTEQSMLCRWRKVELTHRFSIWYPVINRVEWEEKTKIHRIIAYANYESPSAHSNSKPSVDSSSEEWNAIKFILFSHSVKRGPVRVRPTTPEVEGIGFLSFRQHGSSDGFV